MKPNRQESEGNLASHTKLRSAAVQLVEAIELLGADDEDARATHAVNAIAGHVAAIANAVEILTFEAGTDDTDWLVDRVGEAITAGLAAMNAIETIAICARQMDARGLKRLRKLMTTLL